VNLASPVEDGQQLYFPTAEEAERWRADMTVSRSGQILTGSAAGLININTADEALLCTLPGIGQAKAQAIIAYRKQKGLFERPEDIMKVAGIKQSAFEKISTQIVVE
jgi:competence protein ComEA